MGNWLHYKQSGEYHLIRRKGNISSYFAFTPNSLSGNLEIEIDTELANLMSTASRLLGQLEGMSAFLPNAAAVESVFMRKEALMSCWLEGIDMPFYDVFDVTKRDKTSISFAQDYVTTTKYGLKKIASSQYTNNLLCQGTKGHGLENI